MSEESKGERESESEHESEHESEKADSGLLVYCDGGSVRVSPKELALLVEYGMIVSPYAVEEIHGVLTGDLPEEVSADD